MNTKLRTFIYVIGIITLCFTLLTSGVSAQTGVVDDILEDESDSTWCLAVGVTSGLGIGNDNSCTNAANSPHQNIDVSFVRSINPDYPQVQQITPIIKTDVRQSAELRVRVQYEGTGNIREVTTNSPSLEDEDIDEAEELVNNRRLYSYEITENTNLISDTYRIKLPNGVQNVSKNNLKLTFQIIPDDSGATSQLEAPIGGFTIPDAESQPTSPDTEDVNTAAENSTLQDTDFDVTVEQEFSGVSRFVDGLNQDRPLYTDDIPPRNFESGDQISYPVGEVINPQQFRSNQNEEIDTTSVSEEQSVIVSSQEHPNEFGHAINVGTAIYGIPQTTHKELNLTYALIGEDSTTQAEINIVNAQGEVIDENQDRTLNNTMAESVDGEEIDFDEREQYQYSLSEDLLSVRSKSFELSNKEIQYINNNYEAYITYEVDGKSGFLLFRSGILSSDERGQPIIYNPENPRVNEDVELSTGILETESEAEFDWELSNGRELGTGKELTTSFESSGTKTVQLTVTQSDTGETSTYTEDIYVVASEFNDDPSTFNISYEIENPKNGEYGTYDIEPEVEELLIPVTVSNDGDVPVERTVEVTDTLNRELGGYEERVIERQEISVPPQSEREEVISVEWEAHEFGNHEVTVRDGTGDSIERTDSQSQTTPVYVYQPATLKVNDQILPESWLVENNFTARITVQNIGDLSTNHPASDAFVRSEFSDFWSSSIPEFDLAGGDVRADEVGEDTTRKYDREGLRYSPRFPSVTVEERQQVDSPFGTRTGTFEFKSEVVHTFMRPVPEVEQNFNKTYTQEIELYKMKIIDLQLVQGPIDESPTEINNTLSSEIYPSPFPYTSEHWTTEGQGLWDVTEIQRNQDKYNNDIIDYPGKSDKDVLPYSGIEAYHPPILYDTSNNTQGNEDSEDSEKNKVYAKVTISNNGGDFTANARVKINAIINDVKVDGAGGEIYYPEYWSEYTQPDLDKINNPDEFHSNSDFTVNEDTQPDGYWGDGFEDNVVGVASTDIEPFAEEQEIYIPILLPNNAENIGEAEFTVRKRDDQGTSQAYIERLRDAEEDQFRERIQVRDFGDLFIQSLNRRTETVDMLCSDGNSNREDEDEDEHDPEGISDLAGNVGEGNCDTSGQAEIDYTYLNRGSETVGITPDMHYRNVTDNEALNQTTYHHQQRSNIRKDDGDLLITSLEDTDLENTEPQFGQIEGNLAETLNNESGYAETSYLRPDELNPYLIGDSHWWSGNEEGEPYETVLEPGEEGTITFNHSFDIPGTYRIQMLEHRIIEDQNASDDESIVSDIIEPPRPDEVLSEYGTVGEEQAISKINNSENIETELTVLDSQKPSARFKYVDGSEVSYEPFIIEEDDFHTDGEEGTEEVNSDAIGEVDKYVSDNNVHNRFEANVSDINGSDVYNGLSSVPSGSDEDVWQGGIVKIDGQQRYNLHPEEAREQNVSSDNVAVNSYSWSGLNQIGTPLAQTEGLALVKITEGNVSSEVTLEVQDTSEFTNNDPNTDSITKQINVKEDTEPPETEVSQQQVEFNYEKLNEGDFIWAGTPAEETDPITTASVSLGENGATDNGVGLKEGTWIHSNGELDNNTVEANFRCTEFWPSNSDPHNDGTPGTSSEVNITNLQGDGPCTGQSTTAGSFTGSNIPSTSDNTSYTSIFEYMDREDGTETPNGEDGQYTIGFKGKDFAGNESQTEDMEGETVQVYNDTADPDPSLDKSVNKDTQGSTNDNETFWASRSGMADPDYHDTITNNACDTVDQGPSVGSSSIDGIGLYGGVGSNSVGDDSGGDEAFKFTSPTIPDPQGDWGGCVVSDTEVSASDLGITGGKESFDVTVEARDWYGNSATDTVTYTGAVDDTKPNPITEDTEGGGDTIEDTATDVEGETLQFDDYFDISNDVSATVTLESDGPTVHGEDGSPIVEATGDFDGEISGSSTRQISTTVQGTINNSSFTVGTCDEYDYGTQSGSETAEASAQITGSVTDAYGNTREYNGDDVQAKTDYVLNYEYDCGSPPSGNEASGPTSEEIDGKDGEAITMELPSDFTVDDVFITKDESEGGSWLLEESNSWVDVNSTSVTVNTRAWLYEGDYSIVINTQESSATYGYGVQVSGGSPVGDSCQATTSKSGCTTFDSVSSPTVGF